MAAKSHLPANSQSGAFRRAAIDVGTNSVKLLVADVRGGIVTPALDRSKQTRLGRGFYRDHRLQPEAIEHTAQVVGEFAREAMALGVLTLRIIATSAAREAVNLAEFQAAVRQRTGREVEVISGEQEADWIYRGVAADERLAGRRLLIVDVGGGSTEFIRGDDSSLRFRNSYRLGTVRLLEKFAPADPPSAAEREMCHEWIRDFVAGQILPELLPAIETGAPSGPQLIGTGGTATVLACISAGISRHDPEAIESAALSQEIVRKLAVHLWNLPIAERRSMTGLPPERADVILTGALIYLSVMEQMRFGQLRVSTRGLRHAAVLPEV